MEKKNQKRKKKKRSLRFNLVGNCVAVTKISYHAISGWECNRSNIKRMKDTLLYALEVVEANMKGRLRKRMAMASMMSPHFIAR